LAGTFENTFQVLFRGNIRAHRKWLEWLVSDGFFSSVKQRYESATNIAKMHDIAQKVVQEEIYNKHDGEGRTGALKDSFYAVAVDEPNQAGVAVISGPVVATSKGPFSSGNPSEFSYAAFFEEPAFNSFLLGSGVDVYNPIKFRPFMEPLERAMEEQAQEASMKALLRAVLSKMPKQTLD